MPATRSRSRLSLSAVLTAALATAPLLAGCQQMHALGANMGLEAQPLPMDPGDPCYAQRAAFNNSPHFMTDKIVTTAAIGGLSGAAMGAGIAAATGGNALKGALIGGVSGLVVGAAAGYFSGLQQQSDDARVLASRVDNDLTEESNSISNITLAFDNLRQCRFAQAATIKSDINQHRIDLDTAQRGLGYERDRFNEELALARSYGVNMQKQTDQFQYAAAALQQKQAPNSVQIRRVATETIPEKRSNFTDSVSKADANAKVAFNLDAGTPTSWLMLPYA